MNESNPISEGVQQLIDRLHDEGVRPGREEGERILTEAKREAARILDDAKEEARRIRNEAHSHVEAEKKAAHDALRVAVRDTVLDLKEQLQLAFEHHVGKMVASKLGETAILERMIELIVTHALEDNVASDVFLLVGTKGLSDEEAEHFVTSVARKMLETGVHIAAYEGKGIRILLQDEGLVIDLSESVLAGLIHRMIVPRFQAIFEGIGS